jgi:hypothetical protein
MGNTVVDVNEAWEGGLHSPEWTPVAGCFVGRIVEVVQENA